MAVTGLKAVYQWVMRTMMKAKGETGIVQTMPKKDLVELNTQITAQRLMQNGIDPTQLKNADQVENVIKRLESRPTTETAPSRPEAKVFDLEGKEIPKGAKIMGGKELKETDEQIKKRLDRANKEGLARIRSKQKMLDDAIDNVSPGLSGDRKVDAELVAEELATRMGKVYDDLPTKERLDLYDEAYSALTDKKFGRFDLDKLEDIDLDEFAQGGRAGFKIGGIDKARRAFLKAAAGVGAGIGALKTGLLGLGKQAPETIEKVTENFSTTLSEAPQYFLDLVTKIKTFGKKSKIGPQERMDEYSYTGKNGDQYTLTEDIVTGDAQIVKDKMGVGSYGDKTFDTINDRTVMEYKAPKQDVDVEAGKGTREAAEYEEYKVEFD